MNYCIQGEGEEPGFDCGEVNLPGVQGVSKGPPAASRPCPEGERSNPLSPLHGLLFLINQTYFICTIPQTG